MSDATPGRLLDELPFRIRVNQELARVRRSGGFVSVAVFASSVAPSDSSFEPDWAQRLSASVRLQDSTGRHRSGVALLMPDTNQDEALRAAERILALLQTAPRHEPAAQRPRAGVATAYGELEGDADALLGAAEDALAEAEPGQAMRTRKIEGRPRVLIVDDDGEFAHAMAEAVSARGFEAHPCTYGVDALERVQTGSYGALFVDLVLRDASGIDVARRALQAHPRRPVILMSGYATTGAAVLDALCLGPVMFVKKPIEPLDLDAALAMIRRLLPGASKRR